jgi:hypothetical protein
MEVTHALREQFVESAELPSDADRVQPCVIG